MGARAPARSGRPPAGACRVALPRGRRPSSRRSSACSRAVGTRCCSPCASGSFERLGHDPRRRRGRGLRQGRPPARPRYPGGAEIDALARQGDPERVPLPRRTRSRAGLLASRASRQRSSTRCATSATRRARRAPGRPRRLLPARDRARAHAAAARGGEADGHRAHRGRRAASQRTPSCGPPCRTLRSRRSRSAPTTRR